MAGIQLDPFNHLASKIVCMQISSILRGKFKTEKNGHFQILYSEQLNSRGGGT